MATIFPTTVPTKRLAASINASSTSFQLNNILGWNGSALTSSDFGTKAYGIFRNPENTILEIFEFDPSTIASASITILRRGLKFTGDLTTEVSANKLTWIRNETLVELGADVPQLLKHFVDIVGDQSIAGIKTFDYTTPPRASAAVTYGASTEEYFATKRYVDSVALSGAPDGSTTAKGVVEEATEAEIEAGTAAGGTSARLFINPSTLKSSDYGEKVYDRYGDYATDSVGTDAYAITLAPVPAAYTAGMLIQFKPGTRNTGACSINVNSLGVKSIKIGGADPADGDLDPSYIYILIYDGTNFEVLNPKARTPTGSIQVWPTSTAPGGFLLCDGSAVSRTTYAALFAVIGTTFGVGDGSTTFNVPNLKNRTPVGVDTSVKSVLEDCEDAWNELVDADVTASLDTVDFQVGSGSAKFVCAAGLGAGDIIATEVIGSTNLYGQTHVSLWIKSSVATSSGDLQLLLDNSANCASPLETLNIPALVANVWTRVHLQLANPGNDAAIVSVGLKYAVDIGACTINVDDICYGENFEIGATGGVKTHTLLTNEMPAHTHDTATGGSTGGNGSPAYPGNSANTTGSTGGGQTHPNMQPYLTMNFIIKI